MYNQLQFYKMIFFSKIVSTTTCDRQGDGYCDDRENNADCDFDATAALTQLITSFVVNVGAMLIIPHMLQVKIRGQDFLN